MPTPESLALVGASRGEAEVTLGITGYPVSAHALTLPATPWTHVNLNEIFRTIASVNGDLVYTPSITQVTPETFVITGPAAAVTSCENRLKEMGVAVVAHAITPVAMKLSRLREILQVIRAANCKLTYTKSS